MLHTISTKNKRKKRVGRGGARGKNCGSGHKGQKSRAGKSIRPNIRDVIQRLPKRRGYNKNRARTVRSNREIAQVVSLSNLETNFDNGAKVTPFSLINKSLINRTKGKIPRIKILSKGDIKKSVVIMNCEVSATAKAKIEKAGGKVINTRI